ncbi:ribonucleoside-diphosphate reductase subunit alpha [Candidatus Similichlamydia laticola]|nr:ribonucleoside-diphosphate reductase subunit alpha [Candidatus Similichlamydia laticola]
MVKESVSEEKEGSLLECSEELWVYLASKLLAPSELPMIQLGREILPFDLIRFVRDVSTVLFRESPSCQSHHDPYHNHFLIVNVANYVLEEIRSLNRSCLESKHLEKMMYSAVRSFGSSLARPFPKGKEPTVPTLSTSRIAVILRNGRSVPWNSEKILQAVLKAMLAQNMHGNGKELISEVLETIEKQAASVANRVTGHILDRGRNQIYLEEIQDCVEFTLDEMGLTSLRKLYSDYRKERFLVRRNRSLEASGSLLSDLVTPDLLARIDIASIGLSLVHSREEIAHFLVKTMHIMMNSKERAQTILLNARSLIEQDVEYRLFAARVLLTFVYEEVLDWSVQDGMLALKQAHVSGFSKCIQRGVALELLDKRCLKMDLSRLASLLNPLADFQFDFLGIYTLYDRYFLHERMVETTDGPPILSNSGKRRLEVPQYMWMRVAMGLSFLEPKPEEAAISYYSLYNSKRFCSSTPTLFNSGTTHPQMASCFGLTCSDEISSLHIDEENQCYPTGIFGLYAECARISKHAGGLGVDFSSVRGKGSLIQGTNGTGLGVVPFLRILNDLALAVNQGGRRRGVICAYLETWHNDVEDFLELRRTTGDERRRTHDLHTANWIPDLFMKRAARGEMWTLFRSNEVADLHDLYGKAFESRYLEYEKKAREGLIYGKVVRASALWKKMLEMLFETGHPWITFKDPCNVRSPQGHVGVIHGLNLCTEIALNNSRDEHFVCNLGSINLSAFVDLQNKTFFWDQLQETVHLAIRILDNVIDLTFYPTIPARKANLRHRPLGLGVMGWQDVLHLLDIPFESEEMIVLADQVTEFISWHACYASVELAKERGPYASFEGSKWSQGLMPLDTLELLEQERGMRIEVERTSWMDWDAMRTLIRKHGMRNSQVLSIAPTASISNIFGCAPSIEPDYRQLFTKSTLSGEQLWLNPYLVASLKKLERWDQEMFEEIKYAKGELGSIERIPLSVKKQFQNAFSIDPLYLVRAAAVRQKWVDQAISLNLFLGEPNLKNLSQLYLQAWVRGLKSTYYLKTKSASDIEDVTVSIKRKVREIAETKDVEVRRCSLSADECESCQ